MRYNVYIEEIIGDKSILAFMDGEDKIKMPLKYLPEGSRRGDVLQIELLFDAFKTLKWREELV